LEILLETGYFKFMVNGFDFRCLRALAMCAALCALSAGCVTSRMAPEFARFAGAPNPDAVLAEFRRTSPSSFTERQTAVVESKCGRMVALGVCSFDKKKGHFALVLMTPTGMKLLQVEKRNGRVISHFSLPGASPGDEAGARMANDAWRIYSHPESPPDLREFRGDRLSLLWREGETTTKLVFGLSKDSHVDLKTKQVSVNGTPECVINYFDYRDMPDGTRRPGTITYENLKYDYFLTIKKQ